MPGHVVTLVPESQRQPDVDADMEAFLQQVKAVQSSEALAAMSGVDHIARLHRPGAKYFNMCARAGRTRASAASAAAASVPF